VFCRKCGTPNDASSQFCSSCGAPLSDVAKQPSGSSAAPGLATAAPARPIPSSDAPVSSQPRHISPPPKAAQASAQTKSWLARKWKLLVGVLVALVLLGTAGVFGILTLVMSSMKDSDVAKEAFSRARSNPSVAQELGTPIEEGWFASGNINVSSASGDADLALPISGPRGKGTVYVTAQKSAGEWTYTLMQAAIGGNGRRIDLLDQPGAARTAPIATPAGETSAALSAPAHAATPAASSTGTAALVTGDTNAAGIVAEVTQCDRKDGVLSIKVRLRNTGSAGKHVNIISGRNYESFYLSASSKKYFILKDTDGTYLTPSADMFGNFGVDVDPGGQYTWWAKFPAPPPDVKTVTLYMPLAAPLEDIPVSDR
jgi:Cytochrome oxidase complex assembly protein 1/zinc-ribbon domain